MFEFRILLRKPSTDEERCETVTCNSDRFLAVLAVIRNKFPGWVLVESPLSPF
jgi:hypothetical protein